MAAGAKLGPERAEICPLTSQFVDGEPPRRGVTWGRRRTYDTAWRRGSFQFGLT